MIWKYHFFRVHKLQTETIRMEKYYPTTESLQIIFNYENRFIENGGLGIVLVDNKMFSIGDEWTYGY